MSEGLGQVEVSRGFEYDEFIEQVNAEFDRHQFTGASELDSSVKFRANIGKFVIPRENTWAAHREIVRDPRQNIGFAPLRYPFFDYVVAENTDYAPLTDPHHKKFDNLVGLRENLAIVRNYIFSEYFPDGSYDHDDAKKVPKVLAISNFLAEAIDNDRYIPNPRKPRIDKSKANQYGSGAQYIYEKILERQTTHDWIPPWMRFTKTHDWGLPKLEDSPFSDANLARPAPPPLYTYTEEELLGVAAALSTNAPRSPHDNAKYHADTINRIADNFVHTHQTYSSVDMMKQPVKRQSVEIAKEILRKLKVKMGQSVIENGLTACSTSNLDLLGAIEGVIEVYEFHLAKATARDPRLLHHPVIETANAAVGKLGYVAKVEALRMAERGGDDKLGQALYSQIMQMPKDWHHPKEKRFGELLDQVEAGLDVTLAKLSQRDHFNPHTDEFQDRRKSVNMKVARSEAHRDGQEREKRNQRIEQGQDLAAQMATQKMARSESAQAMQQGRPAQPQSGNRKLNANLLNKDQVAKMRNSMKTNQSAQPVEVGAKASIRQAIRERDMAVKRAEEQRRQGNKNKQNVKQIEAMNRANRRQELNDLPNLAAKKGAGQSI